MLYISFFYYIYYSVYYLFFAMRQTLALIHYTIYI